MLKNWRIWLGLIISVAFLYWVIVQVQDIERVGEALRQAQYFYLVPAIVAYFAGVWLRTLRWRFLLRPVKPVAATRLFSVVVIGYMANDVLPARMGEFVRAYVLGQREGISKSTSLATIVLERVFDGLAMLTFLAAVALVFPFSSYLQNLAVLTTALFLVALGGAIFLAFRPGVAQAAFARLLPLLPARLKAGSERIVVSGLGGLTAMRSRSTLLAAFLLSVGAWLCEAGMYMLVAMGFFGTLPFEAVLLSVAVANLGTMIPSSPGYVGTFDALAMFSLGLFGYGGETVLAYVAVLHMALIVPVTLLGFFYLWRENLSLGGLQAARSASLQTPTAE